MNWLVAFFLLWNLSIYKIRCKTLKPLMMYVKDSTMLSSFKNCYYVVSGGHWDTEGAGTPSSTVSGGGGAPSLPVSLPPLQWVWEVGLYDAPVNGQGSRSTPGWSISKPPQPRDTPFSSSADLRLFGFPLWLLCLSREWSQTWTGRRDTPSNIHISFTHFKGLEET